MIRSSLDLMKASISRDDESTSEDTSHNQGTRVPVPKSWFADPFSMLDQLGLGYRAAPGMMSFETLQRMSERNVPVAATIFTRVAQVASFARPQINKYSVGFKFQHRDEDKRKRRPTDGERERMKHLKGFTVNCGLDHDAGRDDFTSYIKKITRDSLVYDQVCTEKIPRMNGKPFAFIAGPAETYRLVPPKKRKGTPAVGREASNTQQYAQIINGSVVEEFTRKELAFGVRNPRSNLSAGGYGLSELEILIRTVTSQLWGEEWNIKAFSQGATMKGFLNFKGNIPPNQLEAFKRQWLVQVASVSNAWKTPIFNAEGVEWVPMQGNNTEMGYQAWMDYLIKCISAVYLIDPAEINFDMRAGTGQQPMFMTTNEAQQKVSKDRGLRPLLDFISSYLNKNIFWEIDPHYEFAFVGLDAKTEEQAIELRLKEVQSYKTLNEVRAEDDLPPVPHGDVPMNPVYTGLLAQQAAGGQPGAPGGAPGGMPGMPPGGPQNAPPGGGDDDQDDQQGQGQPPGMAPSGPQMPQDEPEDAGVDPDSPEAFAKLLGQPGEAPAFGEEEQGAGQAVQQHAQAARTPPAQNKDEELDSDEAWEATIHASMSKRRSPLTSQLMKALQPLEELLD